jgi:hypothetical protein
MSPHEQQLAYRTDLHTRGRNYIADHYFEFLKLR